LIFSPTAVAGCFVVAPQRFADERGFFARVYGRREFAARGLACEYAHTSVSFNPRRGTLRGLHFQAAPHAEAKLVRCTAGTVWDVAVDLRRESPTYLQYAAATLSAENHLALYIPEGCAHGFVTLTDATEIAYQISAEYDPASGRGVRFNDAAFAIPWPAAVVVISERDATYPDYEASLTPDPSASGRGAGGEG
jgi:dTDP-4-dehydrorhamnose 3,5-epimerase